MPDKEYSSRLCQYIGKVELEALSSKNLYDYFYHASESLHNEDLSEEDLKLAREFLECRIRETKPVNTS